MMIVIKVSTTGIIIGVQFGVTFVEEMDAFLIKMIPCNVLSVMLHVIPCLNEHRTQKKRNKSLCKKMLFCPYCKVKLHNYKTNGIDLDKHTCGESFVKTAKSCIIIMKKKTFTNVL